MAASSIPTYALYGEFSDNLSADWVHCETIQFRSRLHNYRIQPHRHETLFQILHLTGGQAEIVVDGRGSMLEAPSIVTLPPMSVHGYAFSPDVEGTVVTLFDSRLSQILGAVDGIADGFRATRLLSLRDHGDAAQTIAASMAAIAAECAGRAPGRLGAVEAHLALVLIALHRLYGASPKQPHRGTARSLHHAMRFRQLVDEDFHSHKPVDAYAGRLGLTATHLNRICREHLGDTALGVIHQRIALEAKRYLTFTSLSAKEVALALAFEDPAYFNRFFKQKTGLSPLSFRAMQKDASS
ncbi:helix-turn-helix domain-containing protein [Microvirga roseola]|uniref:helix-turn-helix domain-containing protein n=1 Tax=Microvirga roseola TaxID=2883126 RepID=UPI001E4EEE1B|nr:helix-turn-helix domain-containing protein [Microvirga roseola]